LVPFVKIFSGVGWISYNSVERYPHSSTTAGAVEDEEEEDNNDDPEELFVFKKIAEASHDSIPFYFHLGFSRSGTFLSLGGTAADFSFAVLIP